MKKSLLFLTDFDGAKINLTKIKSHIIGGLSVFFIDFNGHKDDENVKTIFKKHSENIKFLGSYVKEADDI
jgi:chorismate mutase/prephenate dehydratase